MKRLLSLCVLFYHPIGCIKLWCLQPVFAQCCANKLLGTLCPESTGQRHPAWVCHVLLKSTFISAVTNHNSVQSHLDVCYITFPSIPAGEIVCWLGTSDGQGSRKVLHWSDDLSQWHLNRLFNQDYRNKRIVFRLQEEHKYLGRILSLTIWIATLKID